MNKYEQEITKYFEGLENKFTNSVQRDLAHHTKNRFLDSLEYEVPVDVAAKSALQSLYRHCIHTHDAYDYDLRNMPQWIVRSLWAGREVDIKNILKLTNADIKAIDTPFKKIVNLNYSFIRAAAFMYVIIVSDMKNINPELNIK